MNYTAHLICYESKPDINGHSEKAFKFIDVESGKEITGRIGFLTSDSNIHSIKAYWNHDLSWAGGESISYDRRELKIRDFNKMVKSWPVISCNSEDMVKYIKDQLKKESK